MKTRPRFISFVLGCTLGAPLACDSEDHPTNTAEREIVFDAEQVRDTIDHDADALFLVDLREPATYVFDQSEAPIDRSHFVVQTRGMDYALPLERFLNEVELDAELDGPTWSLAATDEAFRGPFHQDPDGGDDGGGCFLVCTSTGSCVLVCPP